MPEHDLVTQDTTVNRDDLQWWLDLAPTLRWTFAKTMQKFPHSYVYAGKAPGFEKADAIRAARVIQTFGRPARFYGRPKIYLDSADKSVRYWVEFEQGKGETVEDCRLVNTAANDKDWGEQDVPLTDTGGDCTMYDQLATTYDRMYGNESDQEENRRVRSMIISHLGAVAPTTLDVGCGTGLILDLSVTSPALYTGVDPSRGMLNYLYRKHSKVDRLIPATAGDALPTLVESAERFDLVISTFGSPSYMDPIDIEAMAELTDDGGLCLFMTYRDGYLPDYYTGQERERIGAKAEMMNEWLRTDFSETYSATMTDLGNFYVWEVTP